MKRNVDLEEISDGRLYGPGDMVKADCGDCRGCHACCCGMGKSVILDPLDVCRLTLGLGKSFEELVAEGRLELNVVDGVILPNLHMAGPEEACAFLDGEGRCSVHRYRPGICRIFPLGRYYRDGGFRYFLQTGECRNGNRTKVKVSKWIDTPQTAQNQEYLVTWHYFLNDCETLLRESADEALARDLNLFLLNLFFISPYEAEQDFYTQFESRLSKARELPGNGGGKREQG